MGTDSMQGKWNEIKGEIRSKWGKLTHDDLDRTKGNIEAIGGLIVQKYGKTKDDVAKALNHIFATAKKDAADKSENVKDRIRESDEKRP